MRALNEVALREFEGLIRQHIPSFEVRFKDESKLMAVLGYLAYPFNPGFSTQYTTTWGKRVYFPSKGFYLGDPARSFRILAHEFVHLIDGKQHPVSFQPSYLFPQLLALLPLIAYAVLAWPHSWIVLLPFVSYAIACAPARVSRVLFWIVLPALLGGMGVLAWWFTGWWAMVLLSTVLFLVPWPAPWRTKWEIRGYGMNVALVWWIYQTLSPQQISSIVPQFTGPSYYFMCWSGSKVRSALAEYQARARSGQLAEESPYSLVLAFLNDGE